MSPTDIGSHDIRESGFTLLELLVVLVILGLMSAAVLIAAPDGGVSLKEEAERLAARAHAAQEQAIIGNRAVALNVTARGYDFALRRGAEWQPAAAMQTHAWERETRPRIAARILFDATGGSEPARILIERGQERLAIDFSGDGEVRVRRAS